MVISVVGCFAIGVLVLGLAAFAVPAAVIGVVVVVVGIVAGIGFGIYNRFQEYSAANGEGPGFWEGVGLVALGILDITGIPFIVEGIVGQRAFGAKMDDFERGERIGMGVFFFATMAASVIKGLRGPQVKAPPAPVVEGRTTFGKVDPKIAKQKVWRRTGQQSNKVKRVNRAGLTLKQKNRMAVEALDKDGGHSDADHGSHVTETQHELRLKTRRTPSGRVPSSAPDISSNFASDAVHLLAYEDALRRLEVAKINTAGGLKAGVTLKKIPFPGAGKGFSLDANGFLLETPIDGYTAVFSLDRTTLTYKLVTLFPEI